MITSASRRTDIPSYFSDWFLNRLKAGYVYVRNPMNTHQISSIILTPDVVDAIVFWTKNPMNMIDKLDALKEYTYYFQFTLTGYGRDIEANLRSKRENIIPTFIKLSKQIGRERVIWRYDPIIINQKYTVEYHVKAFREIADTLKNYTEKVVISFVDLYKKIYRNARDLDIKEIGNQDMEFLANKLSSIAHENNLIIETCAEKIDLSVYGIKHGKCIDDILLKRITGSDILFNKDKNQRQECGCIESIDIGTYNTCKNGCKYCYANYSEARVDQNLLLYDANSPLLCGKINDGDIVTERKIRTCKNNQINMFENTLFGPKD